MCRRIRGTSISRTSWRKTLEQLWFRGCHCDVGGGYADHGLADVTLEWMYKAAIAHGLVFKGKLLAELQPDPLANMIGFGFGLERVVLRPLLGRPVVAVIM